MMRSVTTTALEKTIRDIWAEALGVDDLQVDDNFFDLGGDSLLATRVFSEMERVVGSRLPVSAAAEYPTVRQMALWVGGEVPPDAPGRTLVRFEPAVAGRTLFCVHGMGGHVLVFGRLARLLSGVTGFAAFESVGRNALDRADLTIDSMAERYIRDMRRVQPRGPYFLAGYSMGGVVAYEMARRLQDAGEEIGLVGLIDSDLSTAVPELLEARIIEFVSKSLGLDPPVEMLYDQLDAAAELICERVNRDRRRIFHLQPSEVIRFAEIYRVNGSAARGYHCKPYPGRVALFFTSGGANSHISKNASTFEAAKALGWHDAVSEENLVAIALPGDHWTLFGSDVEHLASALTSELQAAGEAVTP